MTRSYRGGNSVDQGIMLEKEKRQGRARASLVCSLGANDANLPCKSRHISRHRAMEGRSHESTLLPFLPFASLPRSLFSAAIMHHFADPKVDEKFSELLSWELSRRAPATNRKFHDVNAIAL